MRKITENAINAFNQNKKFSSGNTTVELDEDTTFLKLHGNIIAAKCPVYGLRVTNAGWSTPTTKERLNGLVDVYQKKGVWFLNDVEWNGNWADVTPNGAWEYVK